MSSESNLLKTYLDWVSSLPYGVNHHIYIFIIISKFVLIIILSISNNIIN